MEYSLSSRIKSAWTVFLKKDSPDPFDFDLGPSYSFRPDRPRQFSTTDRTILSSIYTHLANDVASVSVLHVRNDQNGRFKEEMNSTLNECFKLRANVDQSGRALMLDAAMTLFEHGTMAIVPVRTSRNPNENGGFDIYDLRVGTITQWYPMHIKVKLYDDRTGEHKEVRVPKTYAAVVENPFYTVMNEPNSNLQRLIRKLTLLDTVDEQVSSGKLDLLIHLPYQVRGEARMKQAEQRRQEVEMQLRGSTYGIGYVDATEKVTQLNRPAENNLLKQVEYLTEFLYSQLGITKEVFSGNADEQTMLNYYNRIVEPVLAAIVDSMRYAFLTKTARSQGQDIRYIRDPFRLVPVEKLSEIADKFTRNEILSSNEFRGIIGYKPDSDPKSDKLVNSNLNQAADPKELDPPPSEKDDEEDSEIEDES